ncbi:Gamma-curcumene synthase [Handroanthus impetiginosus]|uniref:Gamma-curcumene synthase n=1 Tax=Handroanthus impetiginosus TaxID=429701 RepID=A0A2G9G6T4_9LAMI|nr:Gamma-curcumene synthase [Handroanthus impetiginosus]
MAATSIEDLRPAKATFDPSLWGDTFSSFSLDDKVQETYAEAIEELKKEAKKMLMAAKSSKLLILIDTIERLGLAYHFEKEIQEKLQEICDEFHANNYEEDLFTTALGFRLLRQHRYHLSSGVFEEFTNKDKKFKETLIDNVEGLLNLYEAAHIRIRGEDILEEAVTFTTHHLTRVLPQLESPIKDKVKRALEHPTHRAVPIIEARLYISIYEKDEPRDEVLLKMAKLNFNYLQNLYKDELSQLSRWNMDQTERIPDWMKIAYQFVMSTYEDYERDATKQEKPFAIPYFKEAVKQIALAYNKELKWIVKRELPSFEEYYANSVITSCLFVLFTAHFPGMKSVTKETIDWLLSEPKIVITAAKIGRYYNDLASNERENMGGKQLTVMDCYMKEHGVSKQEACSKFAELIEEGWKDLNTEWITNTHSIPEHILVQLLNYVREARGTYNNGEDRVTNPQVLVPYIHALFVEPIVV